MINNEFTHAKRIFDFYMEKCTEDISSTTAPYATQYANLKLLRFRTNSILNALESYDIKVSE